MNKVYLGIGSNVGFRKENIISALQLLEEQEHLYISEVSSLYETKPYGMVKQNKFLNCVVKADTDYLPEELLRRIKKIETRVGRKKTFRWGPRVIDIDILYFNNIVYNSDNLRIPHPDLLNRDFVIEPLLELNKDLIHPDKNKKLAELVSSDLSRNIIKRIEFTPNI